MFRRQLLTKLRTDLCQRYLRFATKRSLINGMQQWCIGKGGIFDSVVEPYAVVELTDAVIVSIDFVMF